MKFILFVEGYTENQSLPQFLKKWLDPRMAKPIGIRTVRFDGWPELIKDLSVKAKMYLEGPDKDNIVAVISLLDLYGPTFYPNHIHGCDERYQWGQKYIEDKVNLPRFFHFFAVHEIEAWLLSQPDIFPANVRNAVASKAQNPELLNFHEPPSKLLERLYSLCVKKSYKKVVNGKELFDKLDLGRLKAAISVPQFFTPCLR